MLIALASFWGLLKGFLRGLLRGLRCLRGVLRGIALASFEDFLQALVLVLEVLVVKHQGFDSAHYLVRVLEPGKFIASFSPKAEDVVELRLQESLG